jgi:hypothetical protein
MILRVARVSRDASFARFHDQIEPRVSRGTSQIQQNPRPDRRPAPTAFEE